MRTDALGSDPIPFPFENGIYVPRQPPAVARAVALVLSICTVMILTYCLSQRWPSSHDYRRTPPTTWLIISIYIDSLLFTTSQIVVRYAFGVEASFDACATSIFFCLSFYLSSKLLIYVYFVERSFWVWSSRTSGRSAQRIKNRLWIFNMTVIIGGYIIVIVLAFTYRVARLSDEGACMIGVQRDIVGALTAYEMLINVYLTLLFLLPLRRMTRFEHRTGSAAQRLSKVIQRCLLGAFVTCLSTGANLTAIVVLEIVTCVLILHWMTSFGDQARAPVDSGPSTLQSPEQSIKVKRPLPSKRISYLSADDALLSESPITTSIMHFQSKSPPPPIGVITVETGHWQTVERARHRRHLKHDSMLRSKSVPERMSGLTALSRNSRSESVPSSPNSRREGSSVERTEYRGGQEERGGSGFVLDDSQKINAMV